MAAKTNLSPFAQGEMAAFEPEMNFSNNPYVYGSVEHSQWHSGFLQSSKNIFRMEDIAEDTKTKITNIGEKYYSHMIQENIDSAVIFDEA